VVTPVESFIAIAERRDHRCDGGQLVEHPVHVYVARMHYEADPREDLETLCRRCSQASGM